MSTENTAPPGENGEPLSVETELEQMRAAETQETPFEPEKEPEKAQDPEKKPEADPHSKMVPLAALHEERRERQRLQAMLGKVNERLDKLVQPVPPQAPNKEERPVDYLEHKISEVAEAIKPVLTAQEHAQQERQQQDAVQRLTNHVLAQRAEFEKTNPDLPKAAEHLNAVRTRELTALGMPEYQAQAQAAAELDQACLHWAAQGLNPAQVAYEFAKARGYTKPQEQPALPDPAKKLEAQAKGVKAAQSLGGGGAVGGGKLTAQMLAEMSDEEFSKLTDAQFRQAMGG